MDVVLIGLVLLVLLGILLCGGIWIAFALAAVGYAGLAWFTTRDPGPNMFTAMWGSSASWELAALPLFVWMGEILLRTKLSDQACSPAWRRGCNRIAGTTAACEHSRLQSFGCGFRFVCGDLRDDLARSPCPNCCGEATPKTMAIGSLAGAGTLGILIPPSIIMVVYAVAADVSIIRVFLAGFIPSLVLMALFSGYIDVLGSEQ